MNSLQVAVCLVGAFAKPMSANCRLLVKMQTGSSCTILLSSYMPYSGLVCHLLGCKRHALKTHSIAWVWSAVCPCMEGSYLCRPTFTFIALIDLPL